MDPKPTINKATPATWAASWIAALKWELDTNAKSPEKLLGQYWIGGLPLHSNKKRRQVLAAIRTNENWPGLLQRLKQLDSRIEWERLT